jgi:eukaryotic-like serine/threonine-protein kinase
MLFMIKTLGHYRVGEQLGRGGMGEVYLADDVSLDRKVALKFLPDAFTGDPERMDRFEREAKLLASLNHPNIAAIYGLEQAEGKRFIVMELVEGETLAQRLNKGPLPIEEALGICRQIAEGLEAAHEKGVIHRDLKPANVMITEGDKVKILDFGLAKALSDETQSVDSSQSPTLTEVMTRPGVILGTAAYMSPEQAKGKAVDKRADIWAFGCILYECLTDKRVFEGETVAETLAAILKGEPDWQALPSATPPNIRFVLSRCLEKNISQRFRDAADVRIEIEEARSTGEAASPAKRPWLAWSIAVILLVVALMLGGLLFRLKAPAVAEPMQFQIPLPDKVNLDWGSSFAVSPDGRHLAFAAAGSDGIVRLWIRALDSLEAKPLAGTESSHIPPLFWSPDSRSIAFDVGGKLKKIDITGGPAQTICDQSGVAMGGSWNRDGVIVFASLQGGLLKRVAASGGTVSVISTPDRTRGEYDQFFPTFLPDGRHFLYLVRSPRPNTQGVYLGSLDSRPGEHQSKRLFAANSQPVWVSSQDSGPGQILFLRERTLMSQLFDDSRLELIGEPAQVTEGVGILGNYIGYFSASTNGVLVYRSTSPTGFGRAMWFDRQGKNLGAAGDAGVGLALSPDDKRAAVSLWQMSKGLAGPVDLWLLDFVRGTNTRLTFSPGYNRWPVWSPDGSKIVFSAARDGGNLYQKLASGAKDEEPVMESSGYKIPNSWSRDGRFLLYTEMNPKTKADLWVLPLEGDRIPIPFLRTEFNEADGHFSPDMRWVAYTSDESGSYEIYVRGFSQRSGTSADTGGKWQVSVGGGTGAHWRKEGKELYYRALDDRIMVVSVTAGAVFQSGTPTPLFQAPADPAEAVLPKLTSCWDVTSDGNRFLLTTPAEETTPFTIILNWQAGLKK